MVTTVHRSYLGEGGMAFINNGQKTLREIIQEAEGPDTGQAAIEITGIVLNTRAMTQLPDHFQVIADTFLYPPCLRIFSHFPEKPGLFEHVLLNLLNGCLEAVFGGDKNICRINRYLLKPTECAAVNRIKRFDPFNIITQEGKTVTKVIICQVNINLITTNPEGTLPEFSFVA